MLHWDKLSVILLLVCDDALFAIAELSADATGCYGWFIACLCHGMRWLTPAAVHLTSCCQWSY